MSAPRSKATKARKTNAIDFDKIRKERDLTLGAIPPVKIGGKHYTLPDSMPLVVTERFAERSDVNEQGDVSILLADMQAILEDLFGETQWGQIKRVIDIADVPPLFTAVFDAYGESVGEASNSGES